MPTDQRAGVKPIAFVIDDNGVLSNPVTLKIRPEDLTRTEPNRVVINQSFGNGLIGWADDFGPGLPTLSISGHTGWRTSEASGLDGAQAFDELRALVKELYPSAVQNAIDTGNDPAKVRLLYLDLLNGSNWSVAVTGFNLRRNKDRPLLYMYSMQVTALDTEIDSPLVIVPFQGEIPAGLTAMQGVVDTLNELAGEVQSAVQTAVDAVGSVTEPVAEVAAQFAQTSADIMSAVVTTVSAVESGVSAAANDVIGIAADIAQVGMNVSRTVSAVANLPGEVRSTLAQVGAAYSEALCILNNSLRPREAYDDYSDLFGASNCSSTTGGSAASPYAGSNPFVAMQGAGNSVVVSSQARSSMITVGRGDPVLSPLSMDDLSRNMQAINEGVTVNV